MVWSPSVRRGSVSIKKRSRRTSVFSSDNTQKHSYRIDADADRFAQISEYQCECDSVSWKKLDRLLLRIYTIICFNSSLILTFLSTSCCRHSMETLMLSNKAKIVTVNFCALKR